MEKVLNQEEIDAMVRAARGGAETQGTEGLAKAQTITPWDVRKAGQIGREQVRSISVLHEGFARSLTNSLGAYLRIVFQAALVSAEHLTYRDFLQGVPEVTYLASCKLVPMGVTGLIQLDLTVAFLLIDVLLGGEGTGTPPTREITEIEEQILEMVMRIICRELQAAWHALSLEFEFEQRQQPDQVQHLMPVEEKTLSLSFEITMADCRGTLNLVVPAVVSNALLRKLSAARARTKPRVRAESDGRLRTRLLQCPFEVALSASIDGVPIRELMHLTPSDLLVFHKGIEQPVTLSVNEREMFAAVAARQGKMRAAQLLERCPEPQLERKHN